MLRMVTNLKLYPLNKKKSQTKQRFCPQQSGMTPLMFAVKDNRTAFLDRMIELGADVGARNTVSTTTAYTPLYILYIYICISRGKISRVSPCHEEFQSRRSKIIPPSPLCAARKHWPARSCRRKKLTGRDCVEKARSGEGGPRPGPKGGKALAAAQRRKRAQVGRPQSVGRKTGSRRTIAARDNGPAAIYADAGGRPLDPANRLPPVRLCCA